MNATVDVLAALDRRISLLAGGAANSKRQRNQLELAEVRAAVAELLQSIDKYLDDSTLDNRMDLIDARNRVGGAK